MAGRIENRITRVKRMKRLIPVVFVLGAGVVFNNGAAAEPTRLRIFADRIPINARDRVAKAYGIPPKHFAALEQVESRGFNNLTRTEKHLQKRWAKLAGRGWTAKQLATSYGPMQVLGLHYRDKGYLPKDTSNRLLNYELAAWYLSKCKEREATWAAAFLRWNGGGNKKYPVLIARELKKLNQRRNG